MPQEECAGLLGDTSTRSEPQPSRAARRSSTVSATTSGRAATTSERAPAPHVTADRGHARAPGRLDVDDRVADVDRLGRSAAHPLDRQQQRRRVRLVLLGVLQRDQGLRPAQVGVQAGQPQGRLGGSAELRGRGRAPDSCVGEIGEQDVDTRIPADQPLGVGVVPLDVRREQLVGPLRRALAEGADQRLTDPRADHDLVLRRPEHGGERVLVGVDDQPDRVDQGPVEVEDDVRPAGAQGHERPA